MRKLKVGHTYAILYTSENYVYIFISAIIGTRARYYRWTSDTSFAIESSETLEIMNQVLDSYEIVDKI